MKTIGLIGGMSWESSIEYYRFVNEYARQRLGGVHFAPATRTRDIGTAGPDRVQCRRRRIAQAPPTSMPPIITIITTTMAMVKRLEPPITAG